MSGYLINFSIYTLAMIGVIFMALFIFKTVMGGGFSKKSSSLKIEDTLKLSPRKTLYVVNAQNEKFLIAADLDRTSLISKLNANLKSDVKEIQPLIREDKSSNFSSFDGIESLNEFASLIDFQKNASKESIKKEPMMRELAKKLSAI